MGMDCFWVMECSGIVQGDKSKTPYTHSRSLTCRL